MTELIDGFDASAVSGRLRERNVAGDDRSRNGFRERDVHRVVCADVVSQPPRTSQKIEMGMTMEIEVGEIRNRFVGTTGRQFSGPHETPQALNHLDVQKVRRVEFVTVSKEAGFHSYATLGLEQKLQQRRRVDDNHADSRSSRMTTAAGVFNVTRFRLWSLASMSARVGRAARRSSSASR